MKQRFIRFGKQLIVLVLLGLSSVAFAIETMGLYEIQIPLVDGAPNQERMQLATEALQQVFVRATGSKAILKNTAIVAALKHPDRYVSQFSYHQNPTGGRFIKVLFNEKQLDELLDSLKQSIWTTVRPVTLIWLVNDIEKPEWVVGEDLENTLKKPLQESLTARGIPYLFPLFDLNDVEEVSEEDAVLENEVPFLAATKRYEADAVLLGKFKQEGTNWQVKWILLGTGEKDTWENKGSNIEMLLEDAADVLAQKLSGIALPEKKNDEMTATSSSELSSETRTELLLNVLGIRSAEQYTKVLESLRHLPFVTGVEVVQVMPGKTIFSLKTTAPQEKMVHAIEEAALLTKSQILGEEGTGSLTYRLVGVP